ncbi:MAG: archaellin/type IV pilin N-terminal domain-containing protein [Candidatus Nanosalina sp.]
MSEKGVTPVIGAALMILIAVSAITSAAVFLRDTTSDIEESMKNRLSEERVRERTSMNIEYAYNNSDSEVSLTVRNTGDFTLVVEKNDAKKWNLYVDGRPHDFQYASHTDPDRKVLNPGGTLTIDTNSGFPSAGNQKLYEVEGTYGTEAAVVCSNTGDGTC